MRRTLSLLVVAALSTVILAAVGPAAIAATKAPVVKAGHCSGLATWKLTLTRGQGPANNKVEADSELFRLANGQRWKSTFKDNGVVFGTSTTTAVGHETSSTRLSATHGTNKITVRSVNLTTGQVCMASATI
jgi:hypothetical protein